MLLKGVQFKKLFHSLWLAFVKRRDEGAQGDISHYEALMTALAATVGTGNIVGVATAISAGGPGALFWMWVTGLVGMATKYSEAVLGVQFRTVDKRGEQSGGPAYYLTRGIASLDVMQEVVPWAKIGKVLGTAFAFFIAITAFGTGNGVQSQAVADAMSRSFGLPNWIVGIGAATLVGAVILGGIRRIGRVAGILVPLMILLYLFGAAFVILRHWQDIPSLVDMVFRSAFSGQAVGGGAMGVGVAQAVRFGVARGMFSNESGLGTGGIAAAAAETNEPVRQAMVSMTQTFIDTLIVCTFTGFAILVSGAWKSELNGANLTQLAFQTGLPGEWGGVIVALGLSVFAFSTMLGWSYYGERNLEYLFGAGVVVPYRGLFVAVIAAASVAKIDLVWLVSDIMNGLMAFPNLVGLLLLSGVVYRASNEYFATRRKQRSVE